MKQKHRPKPRRSRRASRLEKRLVTAFIALLVLALIGFGAYTAKWYFDLARIHASADRYRGMYPGAATAAPVEATAAPAEATAAPAETTAAPTDAIAATSEPTAVPTDMPTRSPTAAPTAVPTDMPTPSPTATPTADPTEAPTAEPVNLALPTFAPTPVPTPADLALPTFAPTPVPTPAPTAAPIEDMPIVVDVPIPTPNGDTIVYALPTPPPVQESFDALLAHNPDTVAFLQIDDDLALPVAQRLNDNDYYLTHNFDGQSAIEGALFLDGMNRLVPEDDCLIVYGHNMKNNTMFGRLSAFGNVEYLKQHTTVRFDTLYENRTYVPFAAFAASTTPGDRNYFDVRQFIFDDVEFEKFVLKLQGRSVYTVPVDVRYGDRLLLLVTCDYRNREGRFILALRQIRADENEADLWAKVLQATAKNK